MKKKWHQDILLKCHLLLRMSIDTAPAQPITLPLPNLIIFFYNFSPCSTVQVCSFPWLLFSPIHPTHQLPKNVSSIKTGTILWPMCLILIFYCFVLSSLKTFKNVVYFFNLIMSYGGEAAKYINSNSNIVRYLCVYTCL